ncbi:PREDICTED: uncharacterized protein LOC109151214 [Ipomoea nil]|uniref:uncharacterized protein LOC109151214 n=1 Tax=Ipomoea nil TaxID=35883 RepID=UPI0009015821|nr:PREDICTED: uncharacterized protein LOC109151214 [Ipomoea nil]
MGLFGRKSLASRVKSMANLAISRISILKNQHHVRCSYARSDIVQLLHLGHHDRALLRAVVVMKEENMCDALAMMENYCHLLIERRAVLDSNMECPEELREGISGLIFAASRFGEFPELQQLRHIFASRFGQEFTVQCVELRKNCGVHPKMIEKLSTHEAAAGIEKRVKVVKQIAIDAGIALRPDQNQDIQCSQSTQEE